MSWKTIFLMCESVEAASAVAPLAAELAQAHEAHLASSFFYPVSPVMAANELTVDPGVYLRDSAQKGAKIRAILTEEANKEQVNLDWHQPQHEDLYFTERLLATTRLSDLIVFGMDRQHSGALGDGYLLPSVLLGAGRPVLVAPPKPCSLAGKPVVIGWSGSREAARAVFDAVPLLRQAPEVNLVQVGDEALSHRDALPTAEIARVLARHDIAITAAHEDVEPKHAGEELCRLAEKVGAGAIVMGAYGHSRMRELILGGATNFVIKHSEIPVLFSH